MSPSRVATVSGSGRGIASGEISRGMVKATAVAPITTGMRTRRVAAADTSRWPMRVRLTGAVITVVKSRAR